MELIFATGNPYKVQEVATILAALGVRLRSLTDVGCDVPEPIEDGATFEENARLKARYYAKHLGVRCLAEDSGLEVDALGGAPGVFSARYSETEGTREERDQANNEKLLAALRGVPDSERGARFVCALAVADPSGAILAEARGTYEGIIAPAPRGAGGFGYDPLLYLPDRGCTSAELTAAEKHARSHRGNALRQLVAGFADQLRDVRGKS
jgi:XTP/dITP diphosphohydrolase